MKQLHFFDKSLDKINSCEQINSWKLFVDGASRNNPGLAGAGIYIVKNDKLAMKEGFFLGSKTNNQAEYLSLLLGIFYIKKYMCKDDLVIIYSDSQLLVRQMLGEYKVKNPALRPLFQLANKLLIDVQYNIVHVVREDNKDADQMANVGIDSSKKVPQDFLNLLRENEIPF